MNISRSAILGIALLVCLCAPVMAAEKVISGPPDLRISIEGSNEYYPDTMVTIPVKVENVGTIDYSTQNPNNVAREDRPNTAKNVVVTVGEGDAPVSVKTAGQLVGDIAGGARVQAPFEVRMNDGEPIQNVPRSLKEEGHKVIKVNKNDDGTYNILVEKG